MAALESSAGLLPPVLAGLSSSLAFVLKWALPGMSPVEGLLYVLGALLAILVALLDWIINVRVGLLAFSLVAFVGVEALRVVLGLSLGLGARLALLSLFSAGWVLAVDLRRRTYRYFVGYRKVGITGGLLRRVERYISGDMVSDVIVVKPLLGRLLGFGHVVPVTPSGLGLGETFSVGAAGASAFKGLAVGVGGGRIVRDIAPREWNCLYGVKNPDRVRDLILLGCAPQGRSAGAAAAER